MAKTVEVHELNQGAQYLVATTTGSGVTNVTYSCDKPLDEKALAKSINAEIKEEGTRRQRHASLLAIIMSDKRLDGWCGKGDPKVGKVAKELRNAVNDAEAGVIGRMIDEGLIKVPKSDNPEGEKQKIISMYRTEDKNYANVKSIVIKFFAFVGLRPINAQGFLIPVAAMQAMVANTLDVPAKDNSYTAVLKDLSEKLAQDKKPDENDIRAAMGLAVSLASTLKAIVAGYDELATANVERRAPESKMQRAPRPEGATQAIAAAKDVEPAPL